MEPGVVAVRLDVGHVGALDEAGHPAALHRDLLGPGGSRAAVAALDHPAHGLGQPLLADGLEQVVDRVQVEGVDGVGLERGDEDDRRRVPGTACEHRASSSPDRPGIRMSMKTPSTSRRAAAERLGRRSARDDLADAVVLAEQVLQLASAGRSSSTASTGSGPLHACTPGWYFGTRTVILVPAPGAVSTTRP